MARLKLELSLLWLPKLDFSITIEFLIPWGVLWCLFHPSLLRCMRNISPRGSRPSKGSLRVRDGISGELSLASLVKSGKVQLSEQPEQSRADKGWRKITALTESLPIVRGRLCRTFEMLYSTEHLPIALCPAQTLMKKNMSVEVAGPKQFCRQRELGLD